MKLWNRFPRRDAGDQGGTPPANNPPANNSPAGQQTPPPAAPDMGALADTLLKAIEGRQRRAENSVLKGMAEQYGMQESELTAILDKAKAEKAAQLPESARQQIAAATEKANERLIAAEVKLLGAGMGLVDADVAMQLIDHKDIKVGDNGAVTGVKEALTALQKAKPYLYGAAQPAGSQGGFNPAGGTTEEEAFAKAFRASFGLTDKK